MALIYIVQAENKYVCYGLSSDTKPTSPPNNCLFVETDTNNVYSSSGGNWALPTAHKTMFSIVTQPPEFPVNGESWILQTFGASGEYMGFACITKVAPASYKLQVKTADGIKELVLI